MSGAVQKKRGPKPKHIAPSADELRRTIELHDHLEGVMRHYGIARSTLHRWMNECGLPLPATKIRRPRGVTPRFVRLARTPDGRTARARLYNIWDKMKKRCHMVSDDDYRHYGARGIRVCDAWRESYDVFRAWAVSVGYAKHLTLDRINGSAGYGPGNCRWATRQEQTYNCSSVYRLTLNGVTKLLPVWARELGVSMEVLRVRKRNGWPDEHVLTVPRGGRCPGFPYGKPGRKPKAIQTSNDSGATK